jgi:hypothetical protein
MKNSDILISTKKEHAFRKDKKEKWNDELIIAYRELAFQIKEKEKRVAEFVMVTIETST